jgi:hypothetical protein
MIFVTRQQNQYHPLWQAEHFTIEHTSQESIMLLNQRFKKYLFSKNWGNWRVLY